MIRRPYICCHMVMSLDGKVTGDFLFDPVCEAATTVYYELNRRMKCDGFICGRVTMEESFTKGFVPDLSRFEPVHRECGVKMDFLVEDMTGFYAIAIDPKGKLGWQSAFIDDDDEGYDKAQVIEVLTEQVDDRYLAYLESLKIPYIFAGESEIDYDLLMIKLDRVIGCRKLLLEGGSITNGGFQQCGLIDELSVVIAPVLGAADDKPLCMNGTSDSFALNDHVVYDSGVVWLDYQRKDDKDET